MWNIDVRKLLILVSYILLFIYQSQNNFIYGNELGNTIESSENKEHASNNKDELDRTVFKEQESQLTTSRYPKLKHENVPGVGKKSSYSDGSSSSKNKNSNSESSSSSDGGSSSDEDSDSSGDSDDSNSSDESSSSDENSSSSDGSGSSSGDETENVSVISSRSRLGGRPGTSTGIGKKRKMPYLQKSAKRIKKLKRGVASPIKKSHIRKFIMNNRFALILAEIEVQLFGSINLALSDYWLVKNRLDSEKELVQTLVSVFPNGESYLEKETEIQFVQTYFMIAKKVKSILVPGYDGTKRSIFQQMQIFKLNYKKIKCNKIQISFIMIYLIFEFNEYFIFNGFLLYILLCSFNELEDIEFNQSLIMVLKNQHSLGSKISAIGGKDLTKFLNDIKNIFTENSKYEIQVMSRFQNIRFPINFNSLNVEEFGLNFCLILLELHILNENRLTELQIFLFFGSRFSSSSLVLLANDIYKLAKQNSITSTDIIASILYDINTFNRIKKRVLALHNLDLKNFKKQFDQCLQAKEGYNELLGIRRNTDIQEKSLRKSTGQERINLNLKYPFLNLF
ncbi:Uncharacterized protein (FLGN family) [Cryptosporidium hominis]|uniref:Uncharacterized protein (FLGN family) n=1 Tax=Cryptosporidium hominis TaxID=237895 RepID=A0ABX5B898_CRYHO|nr:Uncharacterized protein (FLGN family) [Cryptosporidium hominis]|eukprot:PPS92656.1 Uncharacterized protein (FLGN family) [Cryptosporidium hominis]